MFVEGGYVESSGTLITWTVLEEEWNTTVFKARSFVPELSFQKHRRSVDVALGRWVSGMLRAFSDLEASRGGACP